MARIRTIKPEFWSDAAIVTLAFEYRLLFQGLWNFADDEGFIENRVAQIKINVFPADNVDIAKGVRALKNADLIEVVKLGDKSVIRILNWKKHQRIDKPQTSPFAAQYAEYQEQCAIPRTFQERSKNVPAGGEGKGGEGRGKEVTQVGGGGHLSSAATSPTTTDLAEPYRCPKHQGVDVACYDCKDAKAAHKAAEAAKAKDPAKRQRDAQAAESAARRADDAQAAREPLSPDAGRKAIELVKASRKEAS